MKQVFYNGGTESYYGCSDPSELVVGKIYEVITENDKEWQTDYTLKGIAGHFNSVWFTDVTDLPETFLAFSRKIPVKGEQLDCYKFMILQKQNLAMQECCNSTIKSVELIGKDTYKTITSNNIMYIITVI